jgi:ribose 5-phosphate isomerase A
MGLFSKSCCMSKALKQVVGEKIAARVKSGETIGIGTGSTVLAAIKCISERVRTENLRIRAVVTSYQSSLACGEAGIEVIDPLSLKAPMLDWGFDGADEVDKQCRLIKGQGAAMLREKIVAAFCKSFIVIVDNSKLSNSLGTLMPVPVECIPEAFTFVQLKIKNLGAVRSELRSGLPGKHGPVVTEKGNLVLDTWFQKIEDTTEDAIKSLPGVVESGLFSNYASEVWVARDSGEIDVYSK